MVLDDAAHVADNQEHDERWTEQHLMTWIEGCAMTQAGLHTHRNWLNHWQWGWHWWQHRSRWSSMAMTDSHPTWGQSPPLELDCTTRPDRRGELLCLTSPDRPIRAARNWEALGPIAGWEGLQRKDTPSPKHQAHNSDGHLHQPTAPTQDTHALWSKRSGASGETHSS